jgi:alcohol dehydrogenase YqhD (iron-dependent ADH family)
MQQVYEETLKRQLYLGGMSKIDVGQRCDLLITSAANYDEDCWEVFVTTLNK